MKVLMSSLALRKQIDAAPLHSVSVAPRSSAARRASFFCCAMRARSSMDAVVSGMVLPNRLK